MSVSWSNDRELILIECYQGKPVLWDAKHKNYKNKQKKHDAWVRISEIMDIPVVELKTKKDSLMSSYRTYRKKVKDSQRSGAGASEIYKPIWFAYDLIDSFLGEGLTCKNTQNTESQSALNDEDEEEAEVEREERDVNENVDEARKAQTVRRRKNPPELLEASAAVKDALSTLKTTLKRKNNTQDQQDDDCDLYGKILAKKLRELPEEEKLQFMYDIDGMFLRRRRTSYQRSSVHSSLQSINTPSPSLSPQPIYSYRHHQFNSPQNSTSAYSDYNVTKERASSSYSAYSEPPIHYFSPIVHMPTNNNEETAAKIIIRSNEVVPSANKQATDPPEYTNIISEALYGVIEKEDYHNM